MWFCTPIKQTINHRFLTTCTLLQGASLHTLVEKTLTKCSLARNMPPKCRCEQMRAQGHTTCLPALVTKYELPLPVVAHTHTHTPIFMIQPSVLSPPLSQYDSTKRSAPAISISAATQSKGLDVGPGPGAYMLKFSRRIHGEAPRVPFTTAPRLVDYSKTNTTPGPM